MSQNINLFNPAFRRKQVAFTFNALVASMAVTLLALVAYYAYSQEQADGLATELRSAEAVLKNQRSYAERLKGENAARKRDAQLDADIARLETELKQARESMEALKGGVLGTQEGFAEYLRAFSRQSVNGLWLTGLTIGGGGELEIRGRTLSPDLVPGYIQRLNRERIMAGRSFARLELAQPRVDPEKAAATATATATATAKDKDKDKDKDAKTAAREPRFLEFSLATAEAARTEKSP